MSRFIIFLEYLLSCPKMFKNVYFNAVFCVSMLSHKNLNDTLKSMKNY